MGDDIEQMASELAGNINKTFGGETKEVSEPAEVEIEHEAAVDPAPEAPVEPEDNAPESWPENMRPYWKTTVKEVRDYWRTREKQMMDGLEQYKGDAAFGKQFRSALDPFNDIIKQQGLEPTKAVQALLNSHKLLSTSEAQQRKNYFLKMAKDYGVDLAPMTENEQVSRIQQEVERLNAEFRGQQEFIRQQKLSEITKEIEQFSQDPKHPYFNEVAEDITMLIKAGYGLEDAYEKAVWANQLTRAKEMERLQQERESEAKRKSQEKAEAAKKAKSVNMRGLEGQSGTTAPKVRKMSELRDILRENHENLAGRA